VQVTFVFIVFKIDEMVIRIRQKRRSMEELKLILQSVETLGSLGMWAFSLWVFKSLAVGGMSVACIIYIIKYITDAVSNYSSGEQWQNECKRILFDLFSYARWVTDYTDALSGKSKLFIMQAMKEKAERDKQKEKYGNNSN